MSALRVTTLFTVHRSLFTLLFLACDATLPPLRGKGEVGRDPYAVFVGGGELDADLYAVSPAGGPPVRITFTNIAELRPALAPDGISLAFLRSQSPTDPSPATVWVMNLLNGAERELVLPGDAGPPRRVGWESDGSVLVVRAANRLYWVNAPPAEPEPRVVQAVERARAESTLAIMLGDPVFTRVVPCKRPRDPRDLCLMGATGKQALLAQGVRDPVRWGSDSVGFFVGDRLQIRPLKKGRPRLLLMSDAPERPREMTFFQGKK